MKIIIPIICFTCLLSSCDSTTRDEKEKIKENIIGFSTSYFNYQFKKATEYSTEDSRKWLQFVASNIGEKDLQILSSQESNAKVSVIDIEYNMSDSSGTAIVEVYDFLKFDTIEKPGHIYDKEKFKINFIRQNGTYKVKMGGPLRSEK